MSRSPNSAPDCVFLSENEYGIPHLDLLMQADVVDLPFRAWGSVARRSRMPGTWHFYCDDYKFSHVWSEPQQVTNTRCVAAVEPNYSTNDQMPKAVVLWGIYRKRWLARWWQTQGVRILVDLNVSQPWEEFNLLGVPRGWSAFATRASDAEIAVLEQHHLIALKVANGEPLVFAVYGGTRQVRRYCQDNGLLHFVDQGNAVRAAQGGNDLAKLWELSNG